MTLTDWVLDIALIAIVFLQVRGRRLTVRIMVLPFIIVGWAASSYLTGVPTGGNDLVLVGLAAGTGTVLGLGAGLATRVSADGNGGIRAKAGALAAVLWVAGVGTRLAFQVYATNGGGASIVRFSHAHDINSTEAWVAALILMAIGEVVGRSAAIGWQAYGVYRATGATLGGRPPAPAEASWPVNPVPAAPGSQDGWQ